MQPSTPNSEAVREELGRILSSSVFRQAERSSKILQYIVEQALENGGERLKEYSIGAEALGRGESFDPRIDSIARVEVSRLRGRLDQYYLGEGSENPIQIQVPKGSYVPIFAERSVSSAKSGTGGTSLQPSWIFAFAISVAGAILLGWWLGRSRDDSAERPSLRLEVELAAETSFANTVGNHFALSPDGRFLVYVVAGASGGSQLQLRNLETGRDTLVPGSEGGRRPFFSPDGTWIAYWAAGKVKKSSISGGSPIILCNASDLQGASWGTDGQIVAAISGEAKLWKIPADGGNPSLLWEDQGTTTRVHGPQLIEGSDSILVTRVGSSADTGTIELLRGGSTTVLVKNATHGRYLEGGFLLYVNQGTLYAQPFDIQQAKPTGPAAQMLTGVDYSPTFGYAHYDIGASGLLIYKQRNSLGRLKVRWLEEGRRGQDFLPEAKRYVWPKIAPNGQYIALTTLDEGESHISILNRDGQPHSSQLPSAGYQGNPLFSADSRHLFFNDGRQLKVAPISQLEKPIALLTSAMRVPWSITKDSGRLAFYQLDPKTHFDLWTVPIRQDGAQLQAGEAEPFLQSPAVETYPAFSPDGKWLAYVSLKSGKYEIYVRTFPDNGQEIQLTSGTGRLPVWRKDKKEILYEDEGFRLWAVPYIIQAGKFSAGKARIWSEEVLGDTGVLANFDLGEDGRVLALVPPDGKVGSAPKLVFVTNFLDEVKRKTQAKR